METPTGPDAERKPRQPKKPKVFPQRKKPAPQPTNVYVRIHDVIRDVGVLGDVLTSKVNSPGVELTPTETCVRRSDRFTYCTLTCDSKALAKKLRYLILKDRAQFSPLIDCSFDDFEPAEVQRLQHEKSKAELRKLVEHEFGARSEQVVRAHEQKLRETQERIDRAKENLRDLYTAKKTREEIAALEHKLEELQQQKREFTAALDGFREKLDALLTEDSYEKEVQSLRKALGVECCRLERALPMYARRRDIVRLVQQHPVSVLLAETGSGKSTQVVQYLLDAGLGERGTIVCTQPRKVAAVSLATHVAQELAGNVGKEVGYKAGNRVKTSPSTKVVYMTDHALLNECLTDPDLKAFSCVVVDEAHERSLFTDLLLTMVKRCVARRPDLRVVITSATIDPQVFVNFFGGACPVMKVSGRTFPVDIVWQDSASEENQFENYMEAAVSKAVEIHEKEPLPGDILVFLTSALEIQRSCDMFRERLKDRTDFTCFQLHGQLQADEQQKVFEPPEKNKRKVVFATNVATGHWRRQGDALRREEEHPVSERHRHQPELGGAAQGSGGPHGAGHVLQAVLPAQLSGHGHHQPARDPQDPPGTRSAQAGGAGRHARHVRLRAVAQPGRHRRSFGNAASAPGYALRRHHGHREVDRPPALRPQTRADDAARARQWTVV